MRIKHPPHFITVEYKWTHEMLFSAQLLLANDYSSATGKGNDQSRAEELPPETQHTNPRHPLKHKKSKKGDVSLSEG